MKDFRKSGSFGGRRDGGGFNRPNPGQNFDNRGQSKRGGRDDGFGRSQMYEATCANCGKRCEVPFRPNGQKPVYCRECFEKQGHAPRDISRRDFGSRQTPFQAPMARQETRDGRIDDIKRQLEAMNAKIDRLVNAIVQTPISQPKPVEAFVEKVIEIKPAKSPKKKTASKKR